MCSYTVYSKLFRTIQRIAVPNHDWVILKFVTLAHLALISVAKTVRDLVTNYLFFRLRTDEPMLIENRVVRCCLDEIGRIASRLLRRFASTNLLLTVLSLILTPLVVSILFWVLLGFRKEFNCKILLLLQRRKRILSIITYFVSIEKYLYTTRNRLNVTWVNCDYFQTIFDNIFLRM